MVEWTELNILPLRVSLFSSVITVKTDILKVILLNASPIQGASKLVNDRMEFNAELSRLYLV
jgi:hypothetical protein